MDVHGVFEKKKREGKNIKKTRYIGCGDFGGIAKTTIIKSNDDGKKANQCKCTRHKGAKTVARKEIRLDI